MDSVLHKKSRAKSDLLPIFATKKKKKMTTMKRLYLAMALCLCSVGHTWADAKESLLTKITQAETFLDTCTAEMYPYGLLQDLRDQLVTARTVYNGDYTSSVANSQRSKLNTIYTEVKKAYGKRFDMNATATDDYATDRGFVHPGCLHTQEDFERVKALLAAGDATATEAYNYLKKSKYAQSSYTNTGVQTVVRGGGSGENYMQAARAASAAYQNAILWRLTGKVAHATCAMNILNSWAKTCKAIGGDTNYALAAGLYGYAFANAAELLRDYEGWKADDFKAFQQWMIDVWYKSAIGFLRGRNGTWENTSKWWQAPGHYWSNWGLCNALCVVSIGVLCDDPYIYNQGLSFYKYDQCNTFKNLTPKQVAAGDGYIWSWGLTEYLGNLVPIECETPDSLEASPWGKISQMQESGRDQGHASMALGLAVDICQVAFNQGDDLFAYMDNRLAGGIEHFAAYNMADKQNLPFVKYIRQSNGFTVADGRGGVMTGDSEASRGNCRPYWDRVMGYYEGIKGITLPYASIARETMGTDRGPGYYGETSGGFDHLGYSTLMCRREKVEADKAQLTLVPYIIYKGKTYQHNELGGLTNTYQTNVNTGVAAGSEITLTAELPEGTADDGTWAWDTGETGNSITITANESRLYRATYTAANGVKSQQVFSIAVQGDSHPTDATQTITAGGIEQETDSVAVMFGETVTLGLSGNNYGTTLWEDCSTASTYTTAPLVRDRDFYAIYTNQNGVKKLKTYHVTVIYAKEMVSVNATAHKNTTTMIVEAGDKVVIGLESDELYDGISCQWTSGATSRTIDLGTVSASVIDTLSYTCNGVQRETIFKVYVRDTTDAYRLVPGNYLVRHIDNDTYLTAVGAAKAVTFAPKDGNTPPEGQVWYISSPSDNAKYNIQTLTDSLYLNTGTKTTKTNPRSPFMFEKAVEINHFAIRTSVPRYFAVYDKALSYTKIATLTDYPFEIIPYDAATAIKEVVNSQSTSTDFYDLSGRKISAPRKGIYITRGKKIFVR